jgi:hypothetical protein
MLTPQKKYCIERYLYVSSIGEICRSRQGTLGIISEDKIQAKSEAQNVMSNGIEMTCEIASDDSDWSVLFPPSQLEWHSSN